MTTLDVAATAQLQREFPPVQTPAHPLPVHFDDNCKNGHGPMERMPHYARTRQRPFSIFQCQTCLARLMLFDAPVTPLLVWSDALHDAIIKSIFFSEEIDRLIAERGRKRQIRAEREHEGMSEPTP